ncbi:MAG: HAD-IA family hydrolase [Candidatus Kerfeldbacteria bacterium]|nr:HAD-IA family hydrolase [Candidatus Kerfeldbacteria bacterium]
MKYRAVLFDIDGVLIESVRANAQFYRDLLGAFGFQGPTDEMQARHNHLPAKRAVRLYAPDQSDALYEQMLARVPDIPYREDLLVLNEDAPTLIPTLASKLPLGLVSNRVRSSIERFVRWSKFEPHFTTIVSVEDTVEHKPHPAQLLHALRQLQLAARDVLYVGDAETDVQAATAAGMPVAQFAPQPHAAATHGLRRLAELEAIVFGR